MGFTYACFIRGVAVLIVIVCTCSIYLFIFHISFVSDDVCEATVLKVFIYAVFHLVFFTPHSCLRRFVNLKHS
jgi:hypothetical protein